MTEGSEVISLNVKLCTCPYVFKLFCVLQHYIHLDVKHFITLYLEYCTF